MEHEQSKVRVLIEQLQTQRDELRVRLHLGKAEARDIWEDLERKWEHLRARSVPVREAVSESSRDIGQAAMDLAEEIRRGYDRLRKLL